jgi:hypothetical protein
MPAFVIALRDETFERLLFYVPVRFPTRVFSQRAKKEESLTPNVFVLMDKFCDGRVIEM